MIDNKESLDIRKVIGILADYVMLNSVATDSTSLYYGRAGMSICLFEASRYLNDEYMEDYAFTLLKQALVNQKNDIRFDAGLSGIGYALSYLIRNKFVDADFNDLFQIQHSIIVDGFIRQDYENMNLKSLMQQWLLVLYFHYVPCDKASFKIKELHKICIEKFKEEWKAMRKYTNSVDKELIASLWNIYLKVFPLMSEQDSYQHIYDYQNLVKDGFLKRDMQSLYYISIIKNKSFNSTSLKRMVEDYITDFYSIDSLYLKTLFSNPYISHEIIQTRIHKLFNNVLIKDLEENIISQLGFSSNSATLSFGVSGLVLGLIGMETRSNRIINEIMPII